LGLRHDGKLIDITTDSLVIETSPGQREYTGWTGDVVSQFVYEIAKPLWWAIHYWDEWVADRWLPQWSYGFSTITTSTFFAQTASPTTRAYDVMIAAEASGELARVRNAPTGINPVEPASFQVWEAAAGNNPTNIEVSIERYNSGGIRHRLSRGFLNFDIGIIAGTRGQYRPGSVTVNTAHVIAVVRDTNLPQDGLAINQSTIDASRTSTTIQGSDFRQTPVTTASYFPFVGPVEESQAAGTTSASQFIYGTAPAIDPDSTQTSPGNHIQLIPGSSVNAQPNAYQWVFNSTGRTYIETSYYPPSFASFGSHTGLARFCVRQREDVTGTPDATSSTTLFSKVNQFLSRDFIQQSIPSLNAAHAPRLTVRYTSAWVFDAGSVNPVTTRFGLPQIRAPRRIQAIGIAPPQLRQPPVNRFGLPRIGDRVFPFRAQTITSRLRIGLPRIPFVRTAGIPRTTRFGTPALLRAVRAIGFSSTTFGLPVLIRGNGRAFKVLGFNAAPNGPKIGQPFIEVRQAPEIRPVGFGPLTKIGTRGYISDGFPDYIYASKLIDLPLEYQTMTFEYDGGRVESNIQVCGLRRWRLEYEGLSEADLAVLVGHFNLAQGRTGTFIFYHRRDEVRYTNCRYVSFDIPARIKKWANNVSIVIERQE
jgi:hypothetical protein